MKKTKENIEDLKLLKKYAVDGSELEAYKEAVAKRDEAEAECRDRVEDLKTACKCPTQAKQQC
jgi:hypothetical protein